MDETSLIPLQGKMVHEQLGMSSTSDVYSYCKDIDYTMNKYFNECTLIDPITGGYNIYTHHVYIVLFSHNSFTVTMQDPTIVYAMFVITGCLLFTAQFLQYISMNISYKQAICRSSLNWMDTVSNNRLFTIESINKEEKVCGC